jgi:uroporphyrinogen decarboxylase
VTPRERVLAALGHRQPDRAPRLLYEEAIGYTPPIERLLLEHCGPRTPREYFEMDITRVVLAPSRLRRDRFAEWLGAEASAALAGGQVDEWGVWWRTGNFHHFTRLQSPLRGIENLQRLKSYPWPDLDQAYRFEPVRRQVEHWHAQGLAVAASAGSVFERSWYLRGMEELLVDMLEAPDIAHFLFDRAAAFQKVVAEQLARSGVDIIILGDDVATQRSLMMRVETWREFLGPRLAATAQAVKAANPASFVFYHSDGNVTALVPDLIQAGMDILNPVQPECMDPAALKQQYGERLSFWGTVSVQKTMPFGSAEEVRAEVRARIREVGRGGGLILAPAHVLSPEVPWENIVAFFEAASEPL